MSSYHLVNVWTEAEAGPGGFTPMTDSMLWLPDNHVVGHPTPAFVYLHGWGGYPYDATPVALGPTLADAGFGFLSLCLRRRGMEGQLLSMPADDLRDIKLAVDYLHVNGFRKIYLLGEQMGGVSGLHYLAKHRDARVKGLAWAEPMDSPASWLQNKIGSDAYQKNVSHAGTAARQGAGMDVRVDLFPQDAPAITQNAMQFLSWWGPQADTRLDRALEDCLAPLLLLSKQQTSLPDILAADPVAGCRRDHASATGVGCAAELVQWATELGSHQLQAPPVEMLHAESGGCKLFALHWKPADGQPVKTITLLVHGLTSSPLSPLFKIMAPVLAQTGTAVVAIETRRSGWAGHESSLLSNDVEDIDVWIERLVEMGYEKIVLAGASMGSISVGRYQSVRQHPNVVAIAHLMPTAECPDWFRKSAGDGSYQAAVEQAKAAIAAGQGASELIDVDIRQPLPSRFGSRFRWTQRADSWLSWWGPEADSRNSVHIANARVPLLLLSGTDDSYNDLARFAELKAAAVNAPSVAEIWYPDIDHGLAGVEAQVAEDLLAWMQQIGVVEK